MCLHKVVLIFLCGTGIKQIVQFSSEFRAIDIWYLQYSKFSPALKLLPPNFRCRTSPVAASPFLLITYGVGTRSTQCL